MADEGRKIIEELDKSLVVTDRVDPDDRNIRQKIIKTEFGNYVTRNVGFISYLREIRDQIETYVNRPFVKRPLNILLAAPPGNGKSFLIKQLISSIKSTLEVSFEEIYVAALENASELYSIFQRVQSINLEGKVPVIFFDEIDSEIGESMLYAKFLAPMWDGTFYLGKDKFFLGKSVFFFAGSTLSVEDASKEILDKTGSGVISYSEYFESWRNKLEAYIKSKDDKLPDFIDRIDAIVRIPPIKKELLGDEWESEYEDLACMLVLKHFPNVKYIGELALRRIRDELINGNSVRTAEKIVFNSRPRDREDTFDISCLGKWNMAFGPNDPNTIGIERSVLQITLRRKSANGPPS